MRRQQKSRSGQALIMVTVGLFAMCGLIGMAVDFGWSFYVRKAAQAAADAAALAAVNNAWDSITTGTTLSCGGAISCVTTDCTNGGSGNLQFACEYARLNGFTPGGDSGRQSVKVNADVTSPPPTAPGVHVYYWATVRTTTTIPQLWSAVSGNATGTVAARATAAIVNLNVRASLIALDRQNDAGPNAATDLQVAGSGATIRAANGIFLSSLDNAAGNCINCGGVTGYPSGPVYTLIRSSGSSAGKVTGGSAGWTWQNQSDGPPFFDPMRNMAQPPLTTSKLSPIAVPGGNLNLVSACSSGCPSGAYFATVSATDLTPTGAPITISGGSMSFHNGSFGDFVFFGGLNVVGATVDFGPGRYVMAGVLDPSKSFDLTLGANANGSVGSAITGGTGTDAGRLFILTDSNYPGLQTQINAVNAVTPSPLPTFYYSASYIGMAPTVATPDSKTTVTLTGLDPTQILPLDTNAKGYTLKDFGPVLIWQDQGFSNVKYTSSGNIDTVDCSGSLDSPCTQTLSHPLPNGTPPFLIDAKTPLVNGKNPLNLNGVVYQPRGSWLRLAPFAKLTAMQMISGAFDFGSTFNKATLDLPPLPTALLRRAVALVE